MAGEKKRCENCWVWVEKDLETCPNCSHTFGNEAPVAEQKREGTRSTIGRPFRFMTFSLLTFIAIITFMNAEGIRLGGYSNGDYIIWDLVGLIPVSMLIAGVLSYIDYRIDD
jgi:hypothetical protein